MKMKLYQLYLIAFIPLVLIGYGWILNIVNLLNSDIDMSGECVLQIVGVFVVPLGAFMGYYV